MWNSKSFYLERMKKKVRLHIYSKKNRHRNSTLWDRSQGVFLPFFITFKSLDCFRLFFCLLPPPFVLFFIYSKIKYLIFFSMLWQKQHNINEYQISWCLCSKLWKIKGYFCQFLCNKDENIHNGAAHNLETNIFTIFCHYYFNFIKSKRI